MSLIAIAWKSMRQRALASSLTGLSVALGVMLMVAVLLIYGIVDKAFNQRSIAYDLIVGPKGSDLQIVLSTVYRIQPPVENLPYLYYQELAADPRVEEAIPFAFGDVTEQGGFPIIGTLSRYFELEYTPGRHFFIKGTQMTGRFDAIIGSRVAQDNGWDLGSTFKMVHGGVESDHVHDEEFKVVGILKQTGTPNDKSVFINLDGFYMLAGHDKPASEALKSLQEFFPNDERIANLKVEDLEDSHDDHGDEDGHDHAHHAHDLPDERKEVTSILLRMKSLTAGPLLAGELKSGQKAKAVNPIQPMKWLMDEVVGNVRDAMVVLTVLIIVVSGISIFVSIYNSMSDRKREIAVMRALGASRQTVFSIILAESTLLCVGGGLLGVLLGHGLVFVAAPIVEMQSGLIIDPLAFDVMEVVLIPCLVLLASLVGFIPGLTAYRTDVSQALSQ